MAGYLSTEYKSSFCKYLTYGTGSLAPLASVTLVRTVSFSIYTNSKEFYGRILQNMFGPNAVTFPGSVNSGTLPKPGDALRWGLGGATAGAAITAIACKCGRCIRYQ